MKKVIILASVASMIDQFNMNNIDILINQGYEVHVAANFRDGNTISDKRIVFLKNELLSKKVIIHQIDFSRSLFRISKNIEAFRQVYKIFDAIEFEFVHCHSPIGSVVARICGRITNTKIIYTVHGFHFCKGAPIQNWIIFYPIEKFLSRWTDILITINLEDFELATKKLNCKKVEYIPGIGVNVKKIKNININPHLREKLGIPSEAVLLLSVGELNKNKNHIAVIESISNEVFNDAYYIICGQGNLERDLQKKIQGLHLEHRVKLLGYRDDIIDLMKISDIFVFPSFREGLPVSVIEAMSSGLPIIASYIRGNADLVDAQKGGILVKSNWGKKQYEESILQLVNDSKKRKSFGIYNEEKAEQYDKELISESMSGIYESIVKRS